MYWGGAMSLALVMVTSNTSVANTDMGMITDYCSASVLIEVMRKYHTCQIVQASEFFYFPKLIHSCNATGMHLYIEVDGKIWK